MSFALCWNPCESNGNRAVYVAEGSNPKCIKWSDQLRRAIAYRTAEEALNSRFAVFNDMRAIPKEQA